MLNSMSTSPKFESTYILKSFLQKSWINITKEYNVLPIDILYHHNFWTIIHEDKCPTSPDPYSHRIRRNLPDIGMSELVGGEPEKWWLNTYFYSFYHWSINSLTKLAFPDLKSSNSENIPTFENPPTYCSKNPKKSTKSQVPHFHDGLGFYHNRRE